MAIVTIETGRSSLPAMAFSEIYDIDPSVRGVRPTIRGGIIYCGTITMPEVLRVLSDYQIDVQSITKNDKTGYPVPLSVERVMGRVWVCGTSPSSSSSRPEVVYEFGQSTSSNIREVIEYHEEMKRKREFYFTRLGEMDEAQALALNDALTLICDRINIFEPFSPYTLDPWHLVTFKKNHEPNGGEGFTLSYDPLQKIAPRLTEVMGFYVAEFMHDGDIRNDIGQGLEDELFIVLGNEEQLLGLKSLAKPR